MKSYTLPEFLQALTIDQRRQFADALCNGSAAYLYQLRSGRRQLGFRAALKAEQAAKEMGYDLPRHKLRPDIWGKS